MVKVYSLDQLNQVFPFHQRPTSLSILIQRWASRDFPPWVQPLQAEWSTIHCLAGPTLLLIMWNVTLTCLGFPQPLLLAQSWWRRLRSSVGRARAVVAAGSIWPVFTLCFQFLLKPSSNLPVEAALVQVSQVTSTWPAWEKTLLAALSGNPHPTPGILLILFSGVFVTSQNNLRTIRQESERFSAMDPLL